MKKITYSILVAALALVACNKEKPQVTIPDDQKERISFSMSDPQGAGIVGTKAGFATETGLLMHIQSDNKETSATEHKFTRTQAVARAEAGSAGYSNVEFTSDAFNRYWDDAHGRDSWLSVYAVAVPGYSLGATALVEDKLTAPSSGTWGTEGAETHTIEWAVKTDGQTRETNKKEDLVYARNIQTGGTDGLYWFNYKAKSSESDPEPNTWQPGNAATADAAKTGATTHGNGRMHFRLSNTSDPSSAGKFDRGHLKFNHSLSRLTITLVEGTGFAKTTEATDFNFDSGKSYVQINDANKKGTLNLVTGSWTLASSEGSGVVKLTPSAKAQQSDNSSYYTLNAQILPGNVWNGGASSPKNVFEFYIDNNQYFVTEAQLYTALSTAKKTGDVAMTTDELAAAGITASTVTLTQGVNYILRITVNKKQVETVTAVLADWSDVHADNENIDNTHVEFDTHIENGTGKTVITSGLHLFRLAEDLGEINTSTQPDAHKYRGTYNDEAVASYADSKWSTNWFFNDNKTAYHFRAINTLACVGSTDNSNHDATSEVEHKKQSNFGETPEILYEESTPRNCTYFNMYNGAIADHDYHWGAPMVTTSGTKYYQYSTTKGYEDLIHKGITSTKSTINITQLHMMSQINVIVRTTDKCFGDGSADPVAASNAIALEQSSTQCEVTLTRLYDHGTVDMGTGLISLDKTNSASGHTAGVKAQEVMTKPSTGITSNDETGANLLEIDGKKYSTKKTNAFTFNVIPQELKRADGTTEDYYVGITIKTPDNNQYYVVKRLSEIVATSVDTSQNQQKDQPIIYWYPNHKYTYTFTITKKGIEAITCTLADWSDVKGENTNIDLES